MELELLIYTYVLWYMYRGATLPPKALYPWGDEKYHKWISYAAMGYLYVLTFGLHWMYAPFCMALVFAAYQPSPDWFQDKVKELFNRSIGTNGRINKFLWENMVARHGLLSGAILGIPMAFFSPWALLLIPAHAIGALGYLKKDNLGISEGVLGGVVTGCLHIIKGLV